MKEIKLDELEKRGFSKDWCWVEDDEFLIGTDDAPDIHDCLVEEDGEDATPIHPVRNIPTPIIGSMEVYALLEEGITNAATCPEDYELSDELKEYLAEVGDKLEELTTMKDYCVPQEDYQIVFD